MSHTSLIKCPVEGCKFVQMRNQMHHQVLLQLTEMEKHIEMMHNLSGHVQLCENENILMGEGNQPSSSEGCQMTAMKCPHLACNYATVGNFDHEFRNRTPQLPTVFHTIIFSVFLKYFLDTEKYEVS